MPAHAIYVYCIVESPRRPSASRAPDPVPFGTAPEVTGLADGVWLVVSSVPLAEYGPGQLEPRLGDVDWVAAAALAHERVVEHFMRGRATVIPLKLFTLFTNQERAAKDMLARRRMWSAALKRIRGCQEWGVRVLPSPPVAASDMAARAPSGTAFLAAKKQVRDEAKDRHARASRAAEDAFRRLARESRDSRRRNAPERATRPPLVDAAFLVPSTRAARFRAAVRRAAAACRAEGAELTLTGPWPAYNFVQEGSTP